MDDNIYFNAPLHFLHNLTDPDTLTLIRRGDIIIYTGQGAWEEDMMADARVMRDILEAKEIPAWVDFWGFDVNHDWPWWRKQLPYYLGQLYG